MEKDTGNKLFKQEPADPNPSTKFYVSIFYCLYINVYKPIDGLITDLANIDQAVLQVS
jgi:hypothetical protein